MSNARLIYLSDRVVGDDACTARVVGGDSLPATRSLIHTQGGGRPGWSRTTKQPGALYHLVQVSAVVGGLNHGAGGGGKRGQ